MFDREVPDARPGMPRLLVAWCPDWPVVAHARTERIPDGTPVALVAQNRVVACSAAARREGVRRGMRRREAQSRCPGLRVLPHDPGLDARAFEPVLAALEQLLPGIHPVRPGTIAVRVRGPARYYGGETAAALAVIGTMSEHGAPARAGVADGLFAAEQAARAPGAGPVAIIPPGGAAAFLAPLPVRLLGDSELAELLPRLGIRTIGEFAALPAADVAARFGPAGARLHALAAGRDPRPATPRIPPRDVDAAVGFEPPLERADQVAFGVRVAAERFVADLLEQRLVCTALRVEITGEDGETSERVWLHPRSFEAAGIVDRVRWQLEGAVRRQDHPVAAELRSPVARVRLSPATVEPAGAHEHGLWGTGPDDAVHAGVARVQGMLGHEGVRTARPAGGRGPADRQTATPWGDRPVLLRDPSRPWPGALPAPHPATVYELPRGIQVVDRRGRTVAVDDRDRLSGTPAAMVSPTGARRPLTAWAGPWPVDERWWDARSARRVHRFQAVDAEGEAWLLALDDRGWWAEGRYD